MEIPRISVRFLGIVETCTENWSDSSKKRGGKKPPPPIRDDIVVVQDKMVILRPKRGRALERLV